MASSARSVALLSAQVIIHPFSGTLRLSLDLAFDANLDPSHSDSCSLGAMMMAWPSMIFGTPAGDAETVVGGVLTLNGAGIGIIWVVNGCGEVRGGRVSEDDEEL